MSSRLFQFDEFSLDCDRYELLRSDRAIKLEKIPMELLILLATRHGHLVTREEIVDKLWGSDVFVDTEHGINTAVRKIRLALRDDSEKPRFVQTVTGKGYRFVGVVKNGNGVMPQESLSAATVVPEDVGVIVAPVIATIHADAAAERPAENRQDSHPVELAEKANPRRSLGTWISTGVIATLVTGLILAATPPRLPRVSRYTQLTRDGLNKFDPQVTDGSRVYFGEVEAQQRSIIAQVSVNGGQVTTLATFPNPPVAPTDYSPVRSELLIGYASAPNSPIWALTLPGGSPLRRIGNVATNGATWSADGESLFYTADKELNVVKADGSDPHKIAAVPGLPTAVRISPDGKVLRFTLVSVDLDTSSLWEVAADGSNLHPLFSNWRERTDYNGWWTPDGKYFVFGSTLVGNWGGGIFAVREKKRWFERRAPQPVELTTGPLTFSAPTLSRDGKKIFVAGYLSRGEVMRYNAKANRWDSYLSGISAADLDFSRDGQWLTYVLIPDGTLWRSRVDGSERLQLTVPPMRAAMPRWSPDGKTIAFTGVKPKGIWTIYTVAADGGPAEQLFSDNKPYRLPSWSPDGGRLVYGELGLKPLAIHVLDLQSRNTSELPGSVGLHSPIWSPDGRFIVALTAPTVRPSKLMRFDTATQRWSKVYEAEEIDYPSFSRNGKYVYFSDFQSGLFRRVELASGKVERVANISPPLAMKQDDFWYWSGLTPDDSPMFMRDTSTREIYALDVEFP